MDLFRHCFDYPPSFLFAYLEKLVSKRRRFIFSCKSFSIKHCLIHFCRKTGTSTTDVAENDVELPENSVELHHFVPGSVVVLKVSMNSVMKKAVHSLRLVNHHKLANILFRKRTIKLSRPQIRSLAHLSSDVMNSEDYHCNKVCSLLVRIKHYNANYYLF